MKRSFQQATTRMFCYRKRIIEVIVSALWKYGVRSTVIFPKRLRLIEVLVFSDLL